ncbi:hypothetical protein AJ79_08426 [Helicocarpus griseus UAMH5409]|uniref:Uncharacterized protein n=1 Tax=Helicocarpus griseus UAMH5409 TaxID=1447875 RepID=A0A2B7WTG3_9EURO|nr:hypothetical protein AJ79_08426 [Helicocarpus griseus UAMH5409]
MYDNFEYTMGVRQPRAADNSEFQSVTTGLAIKGRCIPSSWFTQRMLNPTFKLSIIHLFDAMQLDTMDIEMSRFLVHEILKQRFPDAFSRIQSKRNPSFLNSTTSSYPDKATTS